MEAFETRMVDTVTMTDVFGLLPPHLPIDHLRIDAQGLDAQLLKSIPVPELARVRKLELETFNAEACSSQQLYEGQVSCRSIEEYLMSHGFSVTRGCAQRGCEQVLVASHANGTRPDGIS